MKKRQKLIITFVIGTLMTIMASVLYIPLGNDVDNGTRSALMSHKDTEKVNRKQNRNNKGTVRTVDKNVSRGVPRNEALTLARAIHGEARGESFQGQVAVGAVIVNRTHSSHFPDSIKEVVFQPGAFDAVDDGQIWLNPDQHSVKAAELALSGYDPTGGAIYYWNPATSTSRWIWSRPIVKEIGDHVFAK